MLLNNKYNLEIPKEDFAKNIRRLTNQTWKLIPMKENEENWEKQLDTVILESAGLYEIFHSPDLLQLLSKLEGLRVNSENFELYRKTVFECINLLQVLI